LQDQNKAIQSLGEAVLLATQTTDTVLQKGLIPMVNLGIHNFAKLLAHDKDINQSSA
jgi:hypothetical protein